MASLAILLGLLVVAIGSGLLPVSSAWTRVPAWLVVSAGVTIFIGGIVIPLATLPAQRRHRAAQR